MPEAAFFNIKSAPARGLHAQGRQIIKRGTTLIQLPKQPSAANATAFHGADPPRITETFTREAPGGEIRTQPAGSQLRRLSEGALIRLIPIIAFVLKLRLLYPKRRKKSTLFWFFRFSSMRLYESEKFSREIVEKGLQI